MNKRIGYILMLIQILFLSSCIDESPPVEDSFVIGNYDNVDVTEYDTIISDGMVYRIDINNDGIDDICFRNTTDYTNWGVTEYLDMMCLNSKIELYGLYETDTIFLSVDTFHYEENVDIFLRLDYSCKETDETDSIYITDPKFKLKFLKSGFHLNDDAYFQPDTFYFRGSSYSSPYEGCPPEYGDSCDCWKYYDFSCDAFPDDEIIYLGIRIKDSMKLGWIMFKLHFSYRELTIYESALEK